MLNCGIIYPYLNTFNTFSDRDKPLFWSREILIQKHYKTGFQKDRYYNFLVYKLVRLIELPLLEKTPGIILLNKTIKNYFVNVNKH